MEEKEKIHNEEAETTQHDAEVNSDQQDTAEEAQAEELTREEQLERDLSEMKDKYTRLFAEFDNFRKRTAKERIEIIRNGGLDVIRDLLPVLDDLERAKSANETASDIDTVKEGFNLIHHKLFHALETKGLKPMNSKGEPFDTEYHEAITNIPAPTDDLKGKVVDVVESGYFLHDSVLRYAKVVVGQ